MTPYEKNNQPITPEADYRLWFAHPFTAGLQLDVELDKNPERRFGPKANSDSNLSLQLRSGWRPAEARQGLLTTGGVFYVEAGLGLFVRTAGIRR